MSELGKRVAVAVVGIPAVLGAMYLGGWYLGGMLGAAAALGSLELYRLAGARGVRPFQLAGAGLAAAFLLIAAAAPTVSVATPVFWALLLGTTVLLATAAIWTRGVAGGPLAAVSVTVAGAVLLGGTLSYAIFLRHLPLAGPGTAAAPGLVGPGLVCYPLVLAWISDTGAYFGGRALGRRKLMPTVSPGKTVAGAVCGILATVLAGAALAPVLAVWLGLDLTVGEGAVGGVLVSLAAQLGDLAESLLKREAGVKDSGRIFPGHGGVLDRVDSLLFAFPTAFWYLSAVL